MTSCACPRTRRQWQDDGTCARCKRTASEGDLMRAIRAVLVEDPACLLWRNEIGMYTRPGGTHPIRYGVCNPGGADLLGCYGPRFLAIECKTPRGRLSADQVNFGRWITDRGGVYAVVRSEAEARALLDRLRQPPKESA